MTLQETVEKGLKAKDLLAVIEKVEAKCKEDLWGKAVSDNIASDNRLEINEIIATGKGLKAIRKQLNSDILEGSFASRELEMM